jgi:UDP-N-acetylglucosamine--N-acetylmuramyl-(pentapeptide) pyrophosphoryl-undecaprenol N-acetylglucosamine transferase
MKVMIACGGTGGHLFPGLAVAEVLTTRQHEVMLLVSEKAVDQTALTTLTACSDPSRVEVQAVSAVGYGGARQLIRFCWCLARSTKDCANVCSDFKPDVVLGMGGFTSAPAVLAARWQRTRTLIHESNAVPGKANRWVGRFVDHVAVGMVDCARFFGRKPVTVTGTPIRATLRRGKAADARDQLGLDRGRLTVLVMGGSQGAHAINEAMTCALPWLDDWRERTQFVHLSGTNEESVLREAYENNRMTAKVMSFCNQMELAYSAADLVIGRAGAATLTEVAVFGLPSILIPFPHAAGDHQRHNAHVFERAGAAWLVEQSQLSGLHTERGALLAEAVSGLLSDDVQRGRMAAAARSLAVANAEERIVTLIERYADQTTID